MSSLPPFFGLCLAVLGIAPGLQSAQTTPAVPPPAPVRVEPGLETAIKWKWWVAPSDEKDWGLPLVEPEPPKPPEARPGQPGADPPGITTVHIEERPTVYEIKRGDALVLIAKKFGMKVPQLQAFNGMTDDKIRAGQTLKIPTLEELKTLQPPPPPPEPEKKPEEPKPEDKKGKKKGKGGAEAKPELSPEVIKENENLALQIFLDREQFSAGPIDGKSGPFLTKLATLYQTSHADVASIDALKAKAKTEVPELYVTYTLQKEDMRFIAPPRAQAATADEKSGKAPKPKKAAATKDTGPPSLTYEQLVASTFLGYLTPWEFVAERYHCDEAFLRRLNHTMKGKPTLGTQFKVPNVIPFEIERSLVAPLQPPANPDKPITASIVEMTRLEVSQGGILIAVMPVASAHSDLRGRNPWTVLDAIPHPRMATKQEVKEQPKPKMSYNLLGSEEESSIPVATPVALPPLDHEQYIPAGPNNPVGILWINLAKAKSTDPLPYGLHGTSIPGQMTSQRGIGGLRLTNWNIARVVHLLPPGTPLTWKQH